MTTANGPNRLSVRAATKLARDKKKALDLLALIARRRAAIEEAFYDVGVALRELLDGKLHLALDLPSFDAMLEAHEILSSVQARKLIAITRHVTRESALAMGAEKAYAMVRHVEATAEHDTVEGLLATDVAIGKSTAKRASAVEVTAATRKLNARKSVSAGAGRSAAAAANIALTKKLRAHLAKLGLSRPEITIGKDTVTIRVSRKAADRL